MQVTILSVNKEYVKTAKGGYNKAEVAYKDEQGKVQGKKIMSFSNQKVFDLITAANSGDVFDIKSEKDDNGYWQWIEATPATAGAQTVQTPLYRDAKSNATPRNTYETPEERAQKQIYIVRQSSLTNAIALSAQLPDFFKKVNDCPAAIIDVAKQFEAYVFGEQFDDGSLGAMKDDSGDII